MMRLHGRHFCKNSTTAKGGKKEGSSSTLGDVRRATEEILEALRKQEISVESATIKLEREMRKDRTWVDRVLES